MVDYSNALGRKHLFLYGMVSEKASYGLPLAKGCEHTRGEDGFFQLHIDHTSHIKYIIQVTNQSTILHPNK